MAGLRESEALEKARRARAAAARLGLLTRTEKDHLLEVMAEALEANAGAILEANAQDVRAVKERGGTSAPIDRLLLDEKRVHAMAQGLREIAALPDPIGEVIEGRRLPNGLEITRVRVPLGVVGIIYESRPNVTADAAGLCLKSGNAVVLRGGSDALHSNLAIVGVLTEAAGPEGLPEGAIEIIETTDREVAAELMRADEYLDVLIPRGGGDLIRRVKRESTVPVIETGEGNCHIYVDASAPLDQAEEIVVNAKCQRPGVCNAAETLLVHREAASEFLPRLGARLSEIGVELRACEESRKLLPDARKACEADWETEFLDLILAIRVVNDVGEAIAHINRYGTKHSEAIITRDLENAQRFVREVDAAAVYVNASTRFTDGGQFGLGAEMGISTQKLHARGPMGLREMTSSKWVIMGQGQVRA